MGTIQQIAEELVNLSVKEVNELAMVMKNNFSEPVSCCEELSNHITAPKEYGMKMKNRKHKKK